MKNKILLVFALLMGNASIKALDAQSIGIGLGVPMALAVGAGAHIYAQKSSETYKTAVETLKAPLNALSYYLGGFGVGFIGFMVKATVAPVPAVCAVAAAAVTACAVAQEFTPEQEPQAQEEEEQDGGQAAPQVQNAVVQPKKESWFAMRSICGLIGVASVALLRYVSQNQGWINN